MKVNRQLKGLPEWIWHLQTLWSILLLSIPAYFASIRAAERVGARLVWYHHVGFVISSLVFGLVLMILFVLILACSS